MAKVWSTFSKTVKGSTVKFSIHEVGTERVEEILDMLLKFNLPEDVFAIASGVDKNSDAIREYKDLLLQMIGEAHHIDVVSLDNGTVVGVSMLALWKNSDPEMDFSAIKFKHQEVKKLLYSYLGFNKHMAALKDKTASSSYDDWGFVVHPDYKGLGIEEEIFKARVAICKDKNVAMTLAWINQPGLLKAVESSGWKVIGEMNLKDFEKEAGVTFPAALSSGYLVVAKL